MSTEASAPRIGVVVVSHQQRFLDECLRSALSQTAPADRVVLVDNGSPATESAASVGELHGVEVVRLGRPRSLATARNVGCEVLDDCDLIASLDGDDLFRPGYLEVYGRAAVTHRADVVHGAAELFGAERGIAFNAPPDGRRGDLRKGNFIPANSMFSRRIWLAANGFDARLQFYEDWDFWLSCAEQGARFHRVDEVLWSYRRHSASMLATAVEPDKAASRRYIREKHLAYIWGPLQWRRVRRKVSKTSAAWPGR